VSLRYDAETVTAARLDAGSDFRTRHFRCASRAGTDARGPAVVVAAPDGPAAQVGAGGRRVADCRCDPAAVSARAGRPRERVGSGLPARRGGGRDWVGVLAGSGDVGGQRTCLRLLPYSASREPYGDPAPGPGGTSCLPGRCAGGQLAGPPGPIARRRGRSTPPGGRGKP